MRAAMTVRQPLILSRDRFGPLTYRLLFFFFYRSTSWFPICACNIYVLLVLFGLLPMFDIFPSLSTYIILDLYTLDLCDIYVTKILIYLCTLFFFLCWVLCRWM